MAGDIEKLLGEVNQRLGYLIPMAEENREELRELHDWKVQRETWNQAFDLNGKLGEINRRLKVLEDQKKGGSSDKNQPPPRTPDTKTRPRVSRELLIQAGALLLASFAGWLATHLYTVAKMAKMLEAVPK